MLLQASCPHTGSRLPLGPRASFCEGPYGIRRESELKIIFNVVVLFMSRWKYLFKTVQKADMKKRTLMMYNHGSITLPKIAWIVFLLSWRTVQICVCHDIKCFAMYIFMCVCVCVFHDWALRIALSWPIPQPWPWWISLKQISSTYSSDGSSIGLQIKTKEAVSAHQR